ncbi:hypothetical protein LCGC14_1298690 [marine sediment metagenome]|uniref:Uncharacterized protein n=1 Tax=marine sediment metagenome TaxID=412755 RepID=A0A0F9KRU8_9ZZZZ
MPGRNIYTYGLFLSEDKLVSQYAQNPSTARQLTNFIPSRAGDLKRKAYAPPFITTEPTIAAAATWYSFVGDFQFYVGGSPARQIILKVSNNVGTFLYKYVAGGTITQLPAGAYSPPHNESGGVPNGWVGDPLLLYSDGLLFISDGFSGGDWTIYDGTDTWKSGLDIPAAPSLNGSSSPGSIQIDIYREYVITEFDSVRKHEGPPSPRFRFTPGVPDTFDVTLDLPARVNKSPGTTFSDWTVGYADKYRIYASNIDGSGRLFRIAEVAATDAVTQFIDTVPFWGESLTTAMQPLEPPWRNQKPKPTLVGAKMHNRFVVRDEDRRSRVWVTGFAEVKEQDPASVNTLETVPGARNSEISDISNQSDFENFFELPNESFEIRAMEWFHEGLMLGTEKSIMFVWGSKPEDFRPANTSTYGFGLFHRNGFLVTTHGLVMFTDDRKIVLDPIILSGTTPGPAERTGHVIDLGWPVQPDLDQTDIRFTNRFQMVHWKQGSERDWLVIAYTTQNIIDGGTSHLLIYDFEVDGWLSFDDVAATCIGLVTEDEGFQFLLAGNSVADRELRVASDFTSVAASPYQAADTRLSLPAPGTEILPANTFRSAMLDMGSPEAWKMWRYLSYYQKGSFTTVVKAWFDPDDIDNLVPGDAITLTFTQLESNEFRNWLWAHKKRTVFEFTIAADANLGGLSGLDINIEDISNVHQ